MRIEHADPFFQPDALRALHGMGSAAATAIRAVTRLLDSPDEAIRRAATAALAAIRVPSARADSPRRPGCVELR